jgi:hypothetical protein
MEMIIPIVLVLGLLMKFLAGTEQKSDRLRRAENIIELDRRSSRFYADANAKALLNKIIATLIVGVLYLLWWMTRS